ncbi:hypothetical protein KP77_09640 [Jeotgalibacillus alimentarius]|uniref:Uncharacterized protein n=1 Tax=Jeotgalibacillus alimentarius TaxID=135826 RepID=A0A0C2VRA3_9BACL|nr:hypothetical protein [Jeotgalibacillus alimentarius]KIL51452.1 hypothetical protein KP77_09640 [Jeotgalibacillus alimentarius]
MKILPAFITSIIVALSVIAFTFFFIFSQVTHEDGQIDSAEAGGYQLSIIQDQQERAFQWTVSNGEQKLKMNETNVNENDLLGYRDAVYGMDRTFSIAMIAGAYILISLIVSLVFFIRNKQERSSPLILIIGVMVGIAVYTLASNTLEYQTALQDAKYYFFRLSQGARS